MVDEYVYLGQIEDEVFDLMTALGKLTTSVKRERDIGTNGGRGGVLYEVRNVLQAAVYLAVVAELENIETEVEATIQTLS